MSAAKTGATAEASGTLRITQIRSAIGTQARHRGTLRALGLGTIGKTVERKDSPRVQGMIRIVSRLVRVEEMPDG